MRSRSNSSAWSTTTGWAARRSTSTRRPARVGERLDDVVVGAQLEAEHAIELLGPRREEDDRDVAGGADPAKHAEPVRAWQHDVEHDEIRAVVTEPLDGSRTVELVDAARRRRYSATTRGTIGSSSTTSTRAGSAMVRTVRPGRSGR